MRTLSGIGLILSVILFSCDPYPPPPPPTPPPSIPARDLLPLTDMIGTWELDSTDSFKDTLDDFLRIETRASRPINAQLITEFVYLPYSSYRYEYYYSYGDSILEISNNWNNANLLVKKVTDSTMVLRYFKDRGWCAPDSEYLYFSR